MATISELRASFDKMNAAQKEQFISKLKLQLQGSKNAEHIKFLDECMAKYNSERSASTSDDDLDFSDLISMPKRTNQSIGDGNKTNSNKHLKLVIIAMAAVLLLSASGLLFIHINLSGGFGTKGKLIKIGAWYKSDLDSYYYFTKLEGMDYFFIGYGTNTNKYEGTFEIRDDTITFVYKDKKQSTESMKIRLETVKSKEAGNLNYLYLDDEKFLDENALDEELRKMEDNNRAMRNVLRNLH